MKLKLHKNSLKLASLYLAILMVISLFFSGIVYELSVQEFSRGIRRLPQDSVINRLPNTGQPARPSRQDFLIEREMQFAEAKNRVVERLALANLLILIGGGLLSYYLAHRTLRPIEEAHESQSRFTADASHELRTPIAAMKAESEVALMDPKLTVKKAKHTLLSNIEELDKLTALTEGLLRLAQTEDGKLPKHDLNLNTVLTQAIDRVLPAAETKQILLNNQAAVDVAVKGHQQSLVEAFVILLDNAVKYSDSKSEVLLTARNEKHAAIVQVADKGVGIKATELPHIFERFYRADSARSKQQIAGYGIGLSIAKNIFDMHHATIKVNSQPGEGSTFTIRLPR